jgi:hypothetical protein
MILCPWTYIWTCYNKNKHVHWNQHGSWSFLPC